MFTVHTIGESMMKKLPLDGHIHIGKKLGGEGRGRRESPSLRQSGVHCPACEFAALSQRAKHN
jgi:hypothetical protein